jgi:CheY-like chemotaxis protein
MAIKNQRKILVIDDDEVMLLQVENILEKSNYVAICTSNGEDGIDKAISEQPDVIFLDRRMPDMDGNSTLMQLQGNKQTKNIPVIMLTGDNMIGDVATSLKLGAVDYIVKPFSRTNILDSLAKILSKKK